MFHYKGLQIGMLQLEFRLGGGGGMTFLLLLRDGLEWICWICRDGRGRQPHVRVPPGHGHT